VIFLVDSGNIRSQQAVVRIGAVQAGLRRDGTGRERLVFAITDAGS
jgi:RimJ/RimL family protein N-acetyltransferase